MKKIYFIALSLLTHLLACAFFMESPSTEMPNLKPKENHQALEVYFETIIQTPPPATPAQASTPAIVKTTAKTEYSIQPTLPTETPAKALPKVKTPDTLESTKQTELMKRSQEAVLSESKQHTANNQTNTALHKTLSY